MIDLGRLLAVWPPDTVSRPAPDDSGWKIVLLIALAIALVVAALSRHGEGARDEESSGVTDLRRRRGRRAG